MVVCMTGFYNLHQEEERPVVIIQEASEFVRTVHGQMPLILENMR